MLQRAQRCHLLGESRLEHWKRRLIAAAAGWRLNQTRVTLHRVIEGGEALASFVAGLGLAPHVQFLASANKVAIGTEFLHRCLYFHYLIY